MKEFRLTVTVPLPEDKFDQARVVVDIEGPLGVFLKALPQNHVMEHDIVTPRPQSAPRKSKPRLAAE